MAHEPVALITAASQGMGAACAQVLARRGYQLALLARSEHLLEVARETSALAVLGDVTDATVIQNFVDAALSKYGRIDAVVNNSGHAAKGELLSLSDEEWQHGFELLFLNIVRMTRLVAPSMLIHGRGAIVNITSFAAKEPDLRFPISATLRATVGNYAKLFSQRYAAQGLRMNNVLPGWIDSHPVESETLATVPMQRAGTPEEIAEAVAFLLSDEARYITGQSLLVDGGLVRAG
jgi:NAD(P)-dependent dehydrogenase (short-subunit alcohol dehydrogenase family)